MRTRAFSDSSGPEDNRAVLVEFGDSTPITPSWFVSATYVGTHLIHTWSAVDLNPGLFISRQLRRGAVWPDICGAVHTIRKYPLRRLLEVTNPGAPNVNTLASMEQLDDGGTERYHGLLLNTRLRLKRSLSLDGNYTWSHCIGLPITTLTNSGSQTPTGRIRTQGRTIGLSTWETARAMRRSRRWIDVMLGMSPWSPQRRSFRADRRCSGSVRPGRRPRSFRRIPADRLFRPSAAIRPITGSERGRATSLYSATTEPDSF